MTIDGAAYGSSRQLDGSVKYLPGPVEDPNLTLDDEFMQNTYKVECCMLSQPHGWKVCPYVHPGEPVKRRHPSTHRGDMCPAVKKGLHCHIGAEHCPYAHNSFELWLHPTRYKTKMCRRGADCPRGICFFAHSESELRQRPVHTGNSCSNAAAAASNSSPAPQPTVTAPGAAGVGVGVPAAPAASAAWMASLGAPALTAAAEDITLSAASQAALAPLVPDPQLLLLQRQLNELKLQHQIEMHSMQEKMLLLHLLQQQEKQQSAYTVACPAALNFLNAFSPGIAATVDPVEAVRTSAASATAALLRGSSGTVSSNPVAQRIHVTSNSTTLSHSFASDAFFGGSSSCSSKSSAAGSSGGTGSSSPRHSNGGGGLKYDIVAAMGGPGSCAEAMPYNAMCANWLGIGCTTPMLNAAVNGVVLN